MNFQIKIAEIIGTAAFIGRLPLAPGTWGSAAALLVWYFIAPCIESPLFLLITLALFFIGVVVSDILIEAWNEDDPSAIVIDEWVGQWIALWLVPHSIAWGLMAFLWFRLFDILKPGPVQLMEDMKSGVGVMMDDVVAGILALFMTMSIHYFWTA
ncbi:MAG: phosphatidylglycerophosphatase A [Candidatus Marinimicrobia bacterium]|nr:phosphatidylglycerophosphatase A [Candidatus Neomarinimicrobiota bacterium]MDP6820686.1 phosphatidylglycerophosphatase A [Candidatus Neomarinimicrobiota bacterium]MDP6861321.1 phosphatidylglycerophosphatase A [Candidatus Neomarinimicrobiota bacterium]MEC9456571.1 phosphatidylglycerophosphatase A [Candidatus Neomarinimicrobiota bacterium]MED5427859.1 phosphatidylglycerophosphatase A [Candidatus Neomarinimicrobiota bacterium]